MRRSTAIAALLRVWRWGGLVRTGIMLAICGLLLIGMPMPFQGLLLPVTMLFIGETELSVRVLPAHAFRRLLAWRMLNTLIATTTLLVVADEWIATAALGLFVVSSSGLIGGRGLIPLTAMASVANVVLPILVRWSLGAPDPFVFTSRGIAVSVAVLPVTAFLLYLRSRRLLAAQAQLNETIADLESAQTELRTSEERLQQWNDQLHRSIEEQTAQLEERNRYLSIINAVSFALAEPMDEFRSLERAARLVARLMGARGAQAFERFGVGEAAHLFVTVAPEDVHAPRLPAALLSRVAESGVPVISVDAQPAGEELPDLGEPYAIVPIAARGKICGAFALLGTGDLTWGDQERHLLLLVGREMGVSLENMRLYREAIERVHREETAGSAARLLDVPDRREQAVSEALALVGEALDARDIALLTFDEGRGRPSVFSALRAEDEGGEDWLESLIDSLPGPLVGRSSPVILGAGGEAPLSDAIEVRGIGTVVLVPVVSMRGSSVLPARDADAADQVAGVSSPYLPERSILPAPPPEPLHRAMSGVIVVAIAAGIAWRPASTELVTSFAYSLARRLESDELVALQRQRIRELTSLASVARTMQSGADIERLYAGFAQALTGLVQYERLYIARVDEFGELSTAVAFRMDGTHEDRAYAVADRAHRWFSLRTASSWHPANGAFPSFVRPEDDRCLVVPMHPKGQVLGAVAFAVTEDVTGDQLRIVEQAVEQLALALDSATLYHQATERASHIQALSNLARIVASVVDLREAFAAFAEEVRWLIPFDRAVLLLLDDSEAEVQPYATYPEESFQTEATTLARSIASAPVDASGAVFLRRTDPAFAHLDWDILGPGVVDVAAVPVGNGVSTAAIFALVHTTAAAPPPDLNALDEVAGLLGVTIERLRLYERAEYSANHDMLTGLPNYRYLQERLYNLREGISDPGESSILMIDMDGLKVFNDVLGHEAGDQIIRIVARELRATCRTNDFVARTGGDEFLVVLEGAGPDEASRAAERIHAALRESHLEVSSAPARIGVSIGIATAPHDARTANGLLHAADQAMYAAKFSGGHRTGLARDHAEHSPTRSVPQRDTQFVETMVRTALDGGTPEELSLVAVAQRWVVGVVSRLEGGVDGAPWARLIVAHEATRAIAHPRDGRDQEMARFLLDRLCTEWTVREDEVARAVTGLAPIAVRLADLQASGANDGGRALGEAVRAQREALGDGVTELHEALFAFALADRLDRRREREAA